LADHIAWHYEVDNMDYMAVQELALGQESLAAADAEQAILHFREAMQYRVDHPAALTGLARALILQHDLEGAVIVAERAVQVTGRAQAEQLAVLAEAYAAAGEPDQAVEAAEEALDVLRRPEQAALGDSIRIRLEAYRSLRR